MTSNDVSPIAGPHGRRADAVRNREKILAAARAAFADPTAEVSMAEVARRAGVGMPTLYRNFAGRRELLETLYVDEVDAVCAAAPDPGDRPADALVQWLRAVYAFFAAKRHIAAELLKDTDTEDPVFWDNRARVLATGRPLLIAAQRAAEVHRDLSFEQVLDLVHAIATIPGEPGHVEPILDVGLSGLRLQMPTGS